MLTSSQPDKEQRPTKNTIHNITTTNALSSSVEGIPLEQNQVNMNM